MAKKENKVKFTDQITAKIIQFVSHIVSIDKIERILGLENGSIEQYSKRSDDFAREIEHAALRMDIEVEMALYKRSVGYETIEEHYIYTPFFIEGSEEPELKLKEIRKVKKFVPPDASAGLIWLYNRRGERWSKNPNVNSSESYEDYAKEKQKALKEAKENL